MTIKFMGGELDAFTRSNSNSIEISSPAGGFDATYCRCAIRVGTTGGNADYVETASLGAVTEAWIHCEYYFSTVSTSASQELFRIVNNLGVPIAKMQRTGSSSILQFTFYIWDGAAFQATPLVLTFATATRYTFDLHFVCGASGLFEIFSSNSLLASTSGAWNAATNVEIVRFSNCSGTPMLSQVIVATEETIGWKLFTKVPGAIASLADWTGTVGDVNELALNETTYMSTSANDAKESFTGAAVSIGTATVKGVSVSMRAKRNVAGPQNLQALLRIDGTNYNGANLSGLDVSFKPLVTIWETNPATGVAWSASEAGDANLQFGFEAKA